MDQQCVDVNTQLAQIQLNSLNNNSISPFSVANVLGEMSRIVTKQGELSKLVRQMKSSDIASAIQHLAIKFQSLIDEHDQANDAVIGNEEEENEQDEGGDETTANNTNNIPTNSTDSQKLYSPDSSSTSTRTNSSKSNKSGASPTKEKRDNPAKKGKNQMKLLREEIRSIKRELQ